MTKVQLGDRARDRVSGFQGIVVGRSEYLIGCTHICLQPEGADDGKLKDSAWFDEPRLEVVATGVHPQSSFIDAGTAETGGPSLIGYSR